MNAEFANWFMSRAPLVPDPGGGCYAELIAPGKTHLAPVGVARLMARRQVHCQGFMHGKPHQVSLPVQRQPLFVMLVDRETGRQLASVAVYR
jgi:hypothetical protein